MLKILIADDEPTIREGLVKLIPWHTIPAEVVGSAANGLEALDLIDTERPDIVITDIRMPGMDGLQLVENICKRYPHIQTIILTGYADFTYAQNAIRYNVCDFILKPSTKSDVLKSIEIARKRIEKDRCLSSNVKEMEVWSFIHSMIQGLPLTKEFIAAQMHRLSLDFSSYVLILYRSEKGRMLSRDFISDLRQFLKKKDAPSSFTLISAPKTALTILFCREPYIHSRNHEEIIDGIHSYANKNEVKIKESPLFHSIEELYIGYYTILEDLSDDDWKTGGLEPGAQGNQSDRKQFDGSGIVRKVEDYIDRNISGDLGMDILADYVHLNISYLSRIFHKQTGKTVTEYITSVRVAKAEALLQIPDMKMYEIAEKVGVSDPSYFSVFFKKATGFAPKKYQEGFQLTQIDL